LPDDLKLLGKISGVSLFYYTERPFSPILWPLSEGWLFWEGAIHVFNPRIKLALKDR
jgi:hypothetical protein